MKLGIIGNSDIFRRRVLPLLSERSIPFDLVAVGSRDRTKGAIAAARLGTYYEVLRSRDVDAVYISLPPALHFEVCRTALENGKHVLCEKPFVTQHEEASVLTALAKRNLLALVENYAFTHHPQHMLAKALLREGAIGVLRQIQAQFFIPALGAGNFRYDRNLGGGALLDVGGYPVRCMLDFFGDAITTKSAEVIVPKGRDVDIHGGGIFGGIPGVLGTVAFGFDTVYQNQFRLLGSEGVLTVQRAFTAPPTYEPQVVIENSKGEVTQHRAAAADQFQLIFRHFSKVCSEPSMRQMEYSHIESMAQLRSRFAYTKEAN